MPMTLSEAVATLPQTGTAEDVRAFLLADGCEMTHGVSVCMTCPVAQYLKKRVKADVWVNGHSARLSCDDVGTNLPESVRRFISSAKLVDITV